MKKKVSPLKIEYVEIGKIKFAGYNPKKFNSKQFGRLGQSIKTVGWLTPCIVNKRTGNTAVDGNQKLKFEFQKGDPTVKVPVIYIDVPLKEEKRISVLLNNTSTPVDAEMMFKLLNEFENDELMDKFKADYEKLQEQADATGYNPDYEIVQEVDEKYNYVIALFDKGVDYFNIETFFNLSKVYDPTKDKMLGKGRAIDGEKILKLINLANKSGYKNIDEIE